MQELMFYVNNSVYFFQAIVALYGTYCAIVVWTRINQKRFKTYEEQSQFLDAIETPLVRGDFAAAAQVSEGDNRALCQLSHMTIENRRLGFKKAKQLMLDFFQREVISDLENRLSGVNIAIKTEPMLGLLGTVLGMMEAFGKLATSENVKAEVLAADISFALITTCVGLTISIPLMFVLTTINVRLRKLQELIATGLTRFLEAFDYGLKVSAGRPR